MVHVQGVRVIPAPWQEVWWVRKLITRYADKAKPRVDLSWGIDEFDLPKINNFKPYSKIHGSANSKSPIKPGIFQKREEEELEKMMKKFDHRKESDASHMFVMDDQSYFHPKERTITESSSDRIRYLENSLLPVSRKDTMGGLLKQEKMELMDLSESRISRRSQSGNKVLMWGFRKMNPTLCLEMEFTTASWGRRRRGKILTRKFGKCTITKRRKSLERWAKYKFDYIRISNFLISNKYKFKICL